MNDWDEFCKKVKPLQKKETIVYHTTKKVKPNKRYYIDRKLDLHNKTIQQAYVEVDNYIEKAKEQSVKNVTIITGRSGPIKEEFPKWMNQNTNVRENNLLKNKGSFSVKMKKDKK